MIAFEVSSEHQGFRKRLPTRSFPVLKDFLVGGDINECEQIESKCSDLD